MAQILVKLKNNSHVEQSKDAACYKSGMPVVIMPDTHIWGKAECPPDFFVLKLPGISVLQASKYLQEDHDGGILIRRRIWRFRIEDMPLVVRNKIQNGVITIGSNGDFTWKQVRNYLRNLKTGIDETGDL